MIFWLGYLYICQVVKSLRLFEIFPFSRIRLALVVRRPQKRNVKFLVHLQSSAIFLLFSLQAPSVISVIFLRIRTKATTMHLNLMIRTSGTMVSC